MYVLHTYTYIYIHRHTYTYTFFRLKPSGRFQQLHFSHFLSVPASSSGQNCSKHARLCPIRSGLSRIWSIGIGRWRSQELIPGRVGLGAEFWAQKYTILDCPVEIPTTKFRRPWCHYKTHIGIDLMHFESWTPFISMISLGSQSWISLISQSFKFSPYH
jgi:hypothetical protein